MFETKLKKLSGNWSAFTDEQKDRLHKVLAETLNVNGTSGATLFLSDNKETEYNASENGYYVYVGTAPGKSTTAEGALLELDETYSANVHQLNSINGFDKVVEQNGFTVAYVKITTKEIYIPIDFQLFDVDYMIDSVEYILKRVREDVIDEVENKDSWVKSKRKSELKDRIIAYMKRGQEQRIKELRHELEYAERNLKEYQEKVKRSADKVKKYMLDLEVAESQEVQGLDKFIEGLDHIANHPKVEDLKVFNKEVVVKTAPLTMKARIEGQMMEFHLGRATIKIDTETSLVRFDSETKRKGYWTNEDPHPHVNGRDGSPCLGNVANTIAILCSDREIYAVFLTCLGYLESANTEDPAGRKVGNWDLVSTGKPYGYVSEEDEEPEYEYYCDRCEDGFDDYGSTVFTGMDSDGDLTHEEYWCEHCADHHATFVEAVDSLVSDDIASRVEAFHEEEEEEDDEYEEEE